MNILLSGSDSQFSLTFKILNKNKYLNIFFFNKSELDITNISTKYSVTDNDKQKKTFNYNIDNWQNPLNDLIKRRYII